MSVGVRHGCLAMTCGLLRNPHAPQFIGQSLEYGFNNIMALLPKLVHWPSKCTTLQSHFEVTATSQHP